MLHTDLLNQVDRLSEDDKTALMLLLLDRLNDEICPMLKITGLSHGSSIIPSVLPDDLKVFPLGETTWKLIALDVDKI
jgi:hypothetical protein